MCSPEEDGREVEVVAAEAVVGAAALSAGFCPKENAVDVDDGAVEEPKDNG